MTRQLRAVGWPLVIFFILPAAACGMPRDPEKTTERIADTHELRVGLTDNPPWTIAQSAQPDGIEAELIRKFASRNGARVVWTRGSETTLAHLLKEHKLDLAIGGFDAQTAWKSTVGVSQPFAETGGKKHVILTAPGENGFVLALDTFLTMEGTSSRGSGA